MPVTLLLWAVVSFIIAISAFGIQKAELPTRIISIATLGTLSLVAILNIAYFWNIWYEKEPYLDDPVEEEEEEAKTRIFPTVKNRLVAVKERIKCMGVMVEHVRIRFRRPVEKQHSTSDNIELTNLST